MRLPHQLALALLLPLAACVGTIRDTTTARGATETLLVSTSIDRALSRLDASGWRDRRLHVDQRFLECVDQHYLVSCLADRLAEQGVILVEAPEQAEVLLEVRAGSVATWDGSWHLGIPALPVQFGGPGLALPEVVIPWDVQQGWTKLLLFARERESGAFLGEAELWGSASEDPIRGVYLPLRQRLEEDLLGD